MGRQGNSNVAVHENGCAWASCSFPPWGTTQSSAKRRRLASWAICRCPVNTPALPCLSGRGSRGMACRQGKAPDGGLCADGVGLCPERAGRAPIRDDTVYESSPVPAKSALTPLTGAPCQARPGVEPVAILARLQNAECRSVPSEAIGARHRSVLPACHPCANGCPSRKRARILRPPC